MGRGEGGGAFRDQTNHKLPCYSRWEAFRDQTNHKLPCYSRWEAFGDQTNHKLPCCSKQTKLMNLGDCIFAPKSSTPVSLALALSKAGTYCESLSCHSLERLQDRSANELRSGGAVLGVAKCAVLQNHYSQNKNSSGPSQRW